MMFWWVFLLRWRTEYSNNHISYKQKKKNQCSSFFVYSEQ